MGESCSFTMLSLWKSRESLSYPKSEDNQQMPARSWEGFMLADMGRSYLRWQILHKLWTSCAELPPVETYMWCLMFGVLRTGRVCVLSMQAAIQQGLLYPWLLIGCRQHTLKSSLHCGLGKWSVFVLQFWEQGCCPAFGCTGYHLPLKLRPKSEGWDLALFAICKSNEKHLQGTFCWTCLENSLVFGLQEHENH